MKPANSPVDRQTRMAAVVFADLVGFSKKSVPAQLAAKEALTAVLQQLVTPYPKDGRVVLDTGDGAAVGFLVSPEFALGLALRLRRELATAPADSMLQSKDLRLGINLGPLKVITDVNGQPNMVGEGINSAERIMSFAEPGQTTASRSFQEAVYYMDASFQSLFEPLGMRADKHGREHEVFRVTDSTPAIDTALQSLGAGGATAPGPRGRVALGRPRASPSSRPASRASPWSGSRRGWLCRRASRPPTGVTPPETVARPAPAAPARSEPAPAPLPSSRRRPGGESTTDVPRALRRVRRIRPARHAESGSGEPGHRVDADEPGRLAREPAPARPSVRRPRHLRLRPAPPPPWHGPRRRARPPAAKPKSTLAGARTPAAPPASAPRVEGRQVSPRCALLLQRATVGEALTPAEQHELVTSCR